MPQLPELMYLMSCQPLQLMVAGAQELFESINLVPPAVKIFPVARSQNPAQIQPRP